MHSSYKVNVILCKINKRINGLKMNTIKKAITENNSVFKESEQHQEHLCLVMMMCTKFYYNPSRTKEELCCKVLYTQTIQQT